MKTYTAEITYTLDIKADSKAVAEYLTKQSVPKHAELTTCGSRGSGGAKYGKLIRMSIVKENK